MKTGTEKGFILPLVIMMTVAFSVILVGLLPNLSAQHRFNMMDENRLTAQYAAETGAKNAIRAIQNSLTSIDGLITLANINLFFSGNTTETMVTHASGQSSTYTVEYHPDKTPGPSPNPSSGPTRIDITSTGLFNGRKYTSKVIFALSSSEYAQKAGGVADLFTNCEYSHLKGTGAVQKWSVQDASGSTPRCASPPSSGNYQVLFKDNPLRDTFTLAYNAACKQYSTTGGGTGYGIYYGATGTADNMTGYVFQYDPGAVEKSGDVGSFFVKKVKAHSTTPEYAYNNEWDDDKVTTTTTTTGSGRNKKTTTTTSTGQWYNEGSSSTACWVPFQDNTGSGKPGEDGTVKVSLNTLKTHMESKTGKTFDIAATHKITIDVSNDPDGSKRQKIYCDEVLILNFVDHTTRCPITFNGSYAGLRVWNAKVDFYNNPDEMSGQYKNSTIIWTK